LAFVIYCQGPNGDLTPHISAPGYKDNQIDGKLGELRETDRENKYELFLPEIALNKISS